MRTVHRLGQAILRQLRAEDHAHDAADDYHDAQRSMHVEPGGGKFLQRRATDGAQTQMTYQRLGQAAS